MNIKSFISATTSKVGVQIKYRKPIKVACIRGEKPIRWLSETTEQIMQFYRSVPPFYDDSVIPALKIAGAWLGDLIDRRKLQMEAIKNNDTNAYGQLIGDLFRSELLSGLWNYSYFKDLKTIDPRFLDDIEDFEIETGRPIETLISQKPFPGEWGLNCGGGG